MSRWVSGWRLKGTLLRRQGAAALGPARTTSRAARPLDGPARLLLAAGPLPWERLCPGEASTHLPPLKVGCGLQPGVAGPADRPLCVWLPPVMGARVSVLGLAPEQTRGMRAVGHLYRPAVCPPEIQLPGMQPLGGGGGSWPKTSTSGQ